MRQCDHSLPVRGHLPRQVYHWLKEDPELKEALEAGRKQAIEAPDDAVRRANQAPTRC